MREFYTVIELSAAIGCNRTNIAKRMRRGTIRGTKIGRDWLIPASEYNRIIREAAIKARLAEIAN